MLLDRFWLIQYCFLSLKMLLIWVANFLYFNEAYFIIFVSKKGKKSSAANLKEAARVEGEEYQCLQEAHHAHETIFGFLYIYFFFKFD